MKVGFTGTRHGMQNAQSEIFTKLLTRLRPTEFHEGDCIGADDQATDIVKWIWKHLVKVVRHPPTVTDHQANNPNFDEIREPNTHFARNRAIVDETEALVATPADMEEPPYGDGGTWYTVRYARKLGRPIYIIWPDGSIREENT